jgi:hypothetical protein
VSAALGRFLVFDEETGDAGAFISADGAGDVGGVAVAGVAVGEQRQLGGVAEARIHVGHLGHGELLHVGRAEQARGGAVAAAGDGLEPGLLGEAQGQGVVRAGQDHDFRRFDQQAKSGRAFHVRPLRRARRWRANVAQR